MLNKSPDQFFSELLHGYEGGRVLDVACGSGQFVEILANALKSCDSITGLDVDQESLDQAQKNFDSQKFSFVRASGSQIPFGDQEFDFVCMSKGLHHMENPLATLQEMKRVLKKGGIFLLNEMHRDALSESQESHMMYHHLRAEIDRQLGISHQQTFYRKDLEELCSKLGLKELVVQEFDPAGPDPLSPENINDFSSKMDSRLASLENHSMLEHFRTQTEALKTRFKLHGISRPTQWVFLGRKPDSQTET